MGISKIKESNIFIPKIFQKQFPPQNFSKQNNFRVQNGILELNLNVQDDGPQTTSLILDGLRNPHFMCSAAQYTSQTLNLNYNSQNPYPILHIH